jgi:hypothetical protein
MLRADEGAEMSLAGPTMIMIILLVGLFIVAGVLIGRTAGSAARGSDRVCRGADCGAANPPNARFCGRCGQKLD